MGVKRATELLNFENIDADEWERSKIDVGKRKVILLEREDERFDIARKMISDTEPDEKIIKYTGIATDQLHALKSQLS